MEWLDAIVNSGIVGAISAAIGYYLRKYFESIAKEREKLSSERRRVYIEILEPYIKVLTEIKSKSDRNPAVKTLLSFEYKKSLYKLNLIGSDEVIKSVNKFIAVSREINSDNSIKPEEIIKCWGELILKLDVNWLMRKRN